MTIIGTPLFSPSASSRSSVTHSLPSHCTSASEGNGPSQGDFAVRASGLLFVRWIFESVVSRIGQA
jgi:hypothetical protein